nr:hypothetical protein [Tanacetum cinerariifolium]
IVISEAVVREILQLNDAEGVVCLPNEDIFAGLAQMGYEKPSTKLTFYKAFFSKFPTQLQQVLNVCSALSKRVENLENDNAAQKLVIIKLKARVKRLEKANMVKSSKLRRLRKDVFNQERMIDDMDMNEGIKLVKDAEVAESKGRHTAQHAEKQAEIYNLDLDHSSK